MMTDRISKKAAYQSNRIIKATQFINTKTDGIIQQQIIDKMVAEIRLIIS